MTLTGAAYTRTPAFAHLQRLLPSQCCLLRPASIHIQFPVRHYRPPIAGDAAAARARRRRQRPPSANTPQPVPISPVAQPPNAIQHLAGTKALIPPPRAGDVLGLTQRHQGVRSVLEHPALVVARQIEMLNVLIGYEQANRYAIKDPNGNTVGYIAEEDSTFSGSIMRQLLRTRRAFKADVLDSTGAVVLRIERPIKWFLNSTLFVRDADGTLIGEAKQAWHLWRRKYDLFRDKQQFAEIDGGFWAWDFTLTDESSKPLGSINRCFVGLAREIFTDTGEYAIQMDNISGPSRKLSLDERAVMLGTAMTIDIDYFSRHSRSGGGWLPVPFFGVGAGGSGDGSDVESGPPMASAGAPTTTPFPIIWPDSGSDVTTGSNQAPPPTTQYPNLSPGSANDSPFLSDDQAGVHSRDDTDSWTDAFRWLSDDEDD